MIESQAGLELHEGLVGYAVLGRDDEQVGEVTRTSLDRTCLFIETRGRLGRKREHVIHRSAIADVDPDAQTITVRATRGDVEEAPEYSDLDGSASDAAADYYALLV